MAKLEIDARTWAELNRLLDAALDQPFSERTRWVENLDSRYDALKPRLCDLLAGAGRTDDSAFLDHLPRLDVNTGLLDDIALRGDQPGTEIGPYRLIRELGRGGMGAVWLAERIDGLIDRPVALKLPHGHWMRGGLAARMARERQILASLTHPSIARLYDAGLSAEGRPFLAIEYVEGQPIDRYCRDRQLDLRSCLRLFTQAARGVAYAHTKLVVHRDLKPAHILVTEDGRVQLLDFGIAKLLDEGQAKETQLTEVSGRALTPAYASPEQIRGEPLTIASDVYSLGVILYELLSAQPPYQPKRASRGALEDAILQTDPVPPSDAAEPRRRPGLRGDVDAIVLKALKKKPEDRYQTVHALVDDIERYLDARPVLARPDSRWYRVRKFVSRNRLAVGAAAAVLAAIVVGATVAAWQARVARTEQARAEQVKEFIASIFREADPTQGAGKVLSGADLLRQAELRVHDRAASDPRLQVELLAIIGESLFGLQESADAARVVAEAIERQQSAGVHDDAVSARLHLVLSQAYEILGRHDDARRALDRSFAGLNAANDRTSLLFIQARLQQAALGIVFGDYAVAEQAAQEAIDTASATVGPKASEVATGLQMLSHVYTLTQRREESVEPARRSYELQLERHARDQAHPKVLESMLYYAQALNVAGDFGGAFTLYKDVAVKTAGVFGSDSRSYGEALSAAVPVQVEIGDLRTAIAEARLAIEIYLKEGQPGSATHAGRVRRLGTALLAARAGTEAAQTLDEAVRLTVTAKSNLETLHARGSLGLALAYLGRFEDADRQLREAIEKSGKASARAHHLASRNLGTSLRLQGRYDEALEWLTSANKQSALQPSHRGDHAHGVLEAGLVHVELGQIEEAWPLLARAQALFDDVQTDHFTPARADLHVGLARLSLQRGDAAAAVENAEKADRFWRGFDPGNPAGGGAAMWLGRSYLELGRRVPAEEAFARADKLLAASPIPGEVRLRQNGRRTTP